MDFAKPAVTMSAVAVRVKGAGMVRQDYGKSSSAARTNEIPSSLATMLRRRLATREPNDGDLVFPTPVGSMRDPSNTEREWKLRRDAVGFPGITTRSFRKTVATALDGACFSARDIADYRGHKNPSVTQEVYMARNSGSKKAAQSMEKLLGGAI